MNATKEQIKIYRLVKSVVNHLLFDIADCECCKYSGVNIKDAPCKFCDGFSSWIPETEKKKNKP